MAKADAPQGGRLYALGEEARALLSEARAAGVDDHAQAVGHAQRQGVAVSDVEHLELEVAAPDAQRGGRESGHALALAPSQRATPIS
ncbi:MAG: hypothetical protein U1F43_15355 [Myxococcota bacterium]